LNSQLSDDQNLKFKLAGKSGINQPKISKLTHFTLIYSFVFKITRIRSIVPVVDLIAIILAAFANDTSNSENSTYRITILVILTILFTIYEHKS
jgi:hypothetical protein